MSEFHFGRPKGGGALAIGVRYSVLHGSAVIGDWWYEGDGVSYSFLSSEKLRHIYGAASGRHAAVSEIEFISGLRSRLFELWSAYDAARVDKEARRWASRVSRSKNERSLNRTLHCATAGEIDEFYVDCFLEYPTPDMTFEQKIADIKRHLAANPNSELPLQWADEYPRRLAARRATQR